MDQPNAAAQQPNVLAPQPNFDLLGEYLVAAGGEIQKARNLSAIVAGEQIVDAIHQIRVDIRQDIVIIMIVRYISLF